jgi:hypothetical protein
MALITNPLTVGYNVQEICNQLGNTSVFNAEFNCIQQVAGDAAASTTTAETAMAYFKTAQTLSRLVIVPTGAATASDTVYATITVAVRDGAGGAAATVATLITNVAGGSWVAFTPKSMGTLTNATIPAGGVLTYAVAKASTGTQLPAFKIFAEVA